MVHYKDINSKYILKHIIQNLTVRKYLDIIHYNKQIQKELDLSIKDYILFSQIEIELKIDPNLCSKDKNIFIKEYPNLKNLFHFYFNDDKKETKKNYINKNENISKIKIIIDYNVTTLDELFKDCNIIQEINFIRFNRKNVTNMSYMFHCCENLSKIFFNGFKTPNVISMNNMFYKCISLKEIDLNLFETKNVTDMSYMFYDCKTIQKLNLTNFNTNKITNMSCMFGGCLLLKELKFPKEFKTDNVIDMSGMFMENNSIKKLDLSNFNTNKVTHMNWMFYMCGGLEELNIINFNTNNVIDMYAMFSGCKNLSTLNINPSLFNTKKAKDVFNMFENCPGILINKIKSENKNIKYESYISN